MQHNELKRSLESEINFEHSEVRRCAQDIERLGIEGLNHARKAGMLIETAKSQSLQLELSFGDREAQIYLKFARQCPEPITDAKTALRATRDLQMATGLLPFPDGHGPQQLHPPNFFSIMGKHLQTWMANWRKHLDASPMSNWTTSALEQWVSELKRPIDKVNKYYDDAQAELRARRQ